MDTIDDNSNLIGVIVHMVELYGSPGHKGQSFETRTCENSGKSCSRTRRTRSVPRYSLMKIKSYIDKRGR